MILFLNILFYSFLFSIENSETTIYGTEILKGKVASLVTIDSWKCDSIVFSYNNDNKVAGYRIFEKGMHTGDCKYIYSTNNIEQVYYDSNDKQQTRLCIEFDNNGNIITLQQYGYIFPDTTNIKLLYKKNILYNTKNQETSAYEYFCDSTPPYQYRYTYDKDGVMTKERINANTKKDFTITKTINDKHGNIVNVSETMPKDSPEWQSATIDYIYDDKGNWIERKVKDYDPRLMDAVNNCTRRIYYVK